MGTRLEVLLEVWARSVDDGGPQIELPNETITGDVVADDTH